MKQEKAEKILALVQALVDGKQLQALNGDINNQWWADDNDPNLNLPDLLRVKPEPRVFYVNTYASRPMSIHETASDAINKNRSDKVITAMKVIEVLDD